MIKHEKVSKYYETDCLQSFILLFMFLLIAKFVKIVIFRLEFPLSFKKTSQSKLEILLIKNFDLSEKIGNPVTKYANFRTFLPLNCSNFRLKQRERA